MSRSGPWQTQGETIEKAIREAEPAASWMRRHPPGARLPDYLEPGYQGKESDMSHPPLTWGRVKAWAEDNNVPDDAVMEDDSPASPAAKFRDLNFYPAGEDGNEQPLFILQHTWG